MLSERAVTNKSWSRVGLRELSALSEADLIRGAPGAGRQLRAPPAVGGAFGTRHRRTSAPQPPALLLGDAWSPALVLGMGWMPTWARRC